MGKTTGRLFSVCVTERHCPYTYQLNHMVSVSALRYTSLPSSVVSTRTGVCRNGDFGRVYEKL